MNALRFYIRQSLMLEAVGQDSWIRAQRDVLASDKGFEPEPTGESDSRLVQALTSGVKSFWVAGTTAYRSRGGAGLIRAGQAAWTNTAVRKGAVVAGVGATAWHLARGEEDASDETKKAAIDRVDQFYDFMLKATTKKSTQIKTSLQTVSLSTMQEPLDAKITAVESNYSKHADNLIRSAGYDDFFTKFIAYKSAVKDQFDAEIRNITGSGDKSTETADQLRSFAHSFLLVHCADMLLVALGDDTELLEGSGLENNQAGKDKIKNIYETSFRKISEDPEIKKAKEFVKEITG